MKLRPNTSSFTKKNLGKIIITFLSLGLLYLIFFRSGFRPNHSSFAAFVITITAPEVNYFDGAAVLAKSIQTNIHGYSYDLIALVHDSVPRETHSFLERFGYKIVVAKTPIEEQYIECELLRDTIGKSGCCGAIELIKLEAYRLLEYKYFILLDTDVIVVRPDAFKSLLESLEMNPSLKFIFNYDREGGDIVDEKGILIRSQNVTHHGHDASRDVLLTHKEPIYSCSSGGYFIGRPSLWHYNYFIDLILKGNWSGSGWQSTHVGGCWGGETVTGIISYYVYANNSETFESDSCRINAQAKSSNKDNQICSTIDVESIEMFHFESSNKPWKCNIPKSPTLKVMNQKWWNFRRMIQSNELRFVGIPEKDGCHNGVYYSIIAYLKNV